MVHRSIDEQKAELQEMYSRFGWKWVVLAYMAAKITEHGRSLPHDLVDDLSLARTRLESGCYPLTEMVSSLRDIEVKLFPIVLQLGEGQAHAMLELLSKAMSGTLQEEDVDMSALKIILSECAIPSVCQ